MKFISRTIPWPFRILLVQKYLILFSSTFQKNLKEKKRKKIDSEFLMHWEAQHFSLTLFSTHWWALQSLENIVSNYLWNSYEVFTFLIDGGCRRWGKRDFLCGLLHKGQHNVILIPALAKHVVLDILLRDLPIWYKMN